MACGRHSQAKHYASRARHIEISGSPVGSTRLLGWSRKTEQVSATGMAAAQSLGTTLLRPGQRGWARESSAHRITRSRAAHSRARVRYTPTRPSSWCLRQRMAISSRLTGCQQSHLRQVRPHPRLHLPQYGRREVGRMQTMSHHGHDTRPKLCCAPMAVTSRRHLLLPAG